MKQGTKSVLIGCHSPIHSILVAKAWKILYGRRPTWRELACIFLHDIGHWGKDYLDDVQQKNEHWRLGANVAYELFGIEGSLLCAGHCRQSGVEESPLYKADKYSWYLAPVWWLWTNNVVEPELMVGFKSNLEAVEHFKEFVRESVETGEFRETHKCYLERVERAKYSRAE